jgi:hypothetical protein
VSPLLGVVDLCQVPSARNNHEPMLAPTTKSRTINEGTETNLEHINGTANVSRHATLCESHKKALNRRDTTLQVPSTEDTPSTTMSATMSRVPRDAAGADTTFIMTSTSAFGNSAARGLRSPIGRPCKGTKESEENGRPAKAVLCTRCPSAGTGATQKF